MIRTEDDYIKLSKYVLDTSENADGSSEIGEVLDFGNAVIAVSEYEREHNISPTTSAKMYQSVMEAEQPLTIFQRMGKAIASSV